MDSQVHGFVSGNLPPSGFDNEVRPDDPFASNGSDPSSHVGVAFAQKKPDADEGNIEGDVSGSGSYSATPYGSKEVNIPGSTRNAFMGSATLS